MAKRARSSGPVREMLRARARKTPLVLDERGASKTPGVSKAAARAQSARDAETLRDLQERLYAEDRRAVLLVLQGMDTSGKDGTIRHVIGNVDPQGVHIKGFGKPTAEELRHDFLWRIRRALPPTGFIGIFNRSHYEDVLVVRVKRLAPKSVWSKRYDAINEFEREVTASGTTIVKVCLRISYAEQGERLLARLKDETKWWKYNPADLDDRARWREYMAAYEDALARCSTPAAPWYVVPADKKWYRDWAVTRILIETLEQMDPRYPAPHFDVGQELARTKKTIAKSPPR